MHGQFLSPEDARRVWSDLHKLLEDFLDRHPQLEGIDVETPESAPNSYDMPHGSFQSLTLSQTFPSLRRLAFHRSKAGALDRFMRRYPRLFDFTLPESCEEQDGFELVYEPATVPTALQGVRCSSDQMTSMACQCTYRSTFPITQLKLDPNWSLDALCFNCYTAKLRLCASTVSCLNIVLEEEDINGVIPRLSFIFHPFGFPGLAELVMTCTQDDAAKEIVPDNGRQAAADIRQILVGLSALPHLRVLYFEHIHAQRLSLAVEFQFRFPEEIESFEYFTWHSPKFNWTQCYHITCSDRHSYMPQRLQALPPVFSAPTES